VGYVVAVTGPVGAGKTTLVNGLAARLPDACAIHFDHYQTVTKRPIDEIARWMRSGADPNAFQIPGLSEALAALLRGEPASDPKTGETIPPRRIVLLDTPFGTLHQETARFIDLLAWIETPLDVALARKVREFTGHFLDARDPDAGRSFVPWLHGYLGNYLDVVADLMRMQKEKLGAEADFAVDGSGPPDAVVERAAREIAERLA
jgi:uridine kinase